MVLPVAALHTNLGNSSSLEAVNGYSAGLTWLPLAAMQAAAILVAQKNLFRKIMMDAMFLRPGRACAFV